MKSITAALIGQPNVGKSTLFNVLTRGNAIVTNWPGTTVERHEGRVVFGAHEIVVIDLPGVYSLTGLTLEEKISRDFLLKNRPDVIVVLVDSLALERTLYLAIEVLELAPRVVVAVTKVDEAHSRGVHVNYELLEKALKVPVVPISAAKGIGIDRLMEAVVRSVGAEGRPIKVDYGELEPFIEAITLGLQGIEKRLGYPSRWVAVKILEGDRDLVDQIKGLDLGVYNTVEELRREAIRRLGLDLAAIVTKKRFELAEQISRGATARVTLTQKKEGGIASAFYNPYIAPVASVSILVGLFVAVFTINTGYPLTLMLRGIGFTEAALWLEEHSLSGLMEKALETLSHIVYSSLGGSALAKFIVEGLLGGVLILVLFIPLIAITLVILGVFEDSGLLTRMAVGLHALLHKIGLSGHALFPMSLCLGCNVPGLVAARANPNASERIRLLMLLPFIPCQARLVVLLAIASAVGGITGTLLIPLAYLTAFSIVVGLSMVMHRAAKKRSVADAVELLLELPPIHRPIPKVVWWYTWFHLKHFIKKIGTVIVLANILIWVASNVGTNLQIVEDASESMAASVSRYLSPILSPLGVSGSSAWMVVFALIAGFVAKELFVAALLTVSGTTSLAEVFNVLQIDSVSIVALALYVTLYVPCIATLATIHSESKSLRLAIKSLALMIVIAYASSIIVHKMLRLMM